MDRSLLFLLVALTIVNCDPIKREKFHEDLLRDDVVDEVVFLKLDLKDGEQRLSKAKSDIKDAEQQSKALEKTPGNADKVQQLKDDLNDAKEKLAGAKLDIQEARKESNALVQKYEKAIEVIENELKETLAQHGSNAASKKRKDETSNKRKDSGEVDEVQELKTDINDGGAKLRGVKSDIKELQELSKALKETPNDQNKVQKLRNDLKDAKAKLAAIKLDIQKAEKRANAVVAKYMKVVEVLENKLKATAAEDEQKAQDAEDMKELDMLKDGMKDVIHRMHDVRMNIKSKDASGRIAGIRNDFDNIKDMVDDVAKRHV